MSLFADVTDEGFCRHFNDFFRREKVGQYRGCRSPKAIGKGLIFLIEQRKLAELEENIRKHVGFFACERFGQMQAMPGQSLQSKELAATPRIGSNPVGTSEIGDDKSIDIVVLAEVNKGLLVVLDGLWIQAVYRSVERSEDFTGREIVRDMYAVK